MTHLAATLTDTGFASFRLSLPLGQWIRVARERRQLAGLSERQFRDVGLDPATAASEAARPFWDLPDSR